MHKHVAALDCTESSGLFSLSDRLHVQGVELKFTFCFTDVQFVVHEAPGQELEIELYDEDTDKDDFLGK